MTRRTQTRSAGATLTRSASRKPNPSGFELVDEEAKMRAVVALHDMRLKEPGLAHAEAEARLVLAAAIMALDEALHRGRADIEALIVAEATQRLLDATADVLRGQEGTSVRIITPDYRHQRRHSLNRGSHPDHDGAAVVESAIEAKDSFATQQQESEWPA